VSEIMNSQLEVTDCRDNPRHLTDRFTFVSLSGPPSGAWNSHSLRDFPAADRSTSAPPQRSAARFAPRRFFNESTYRTPAPLLTSTVIDSRSPGPRNRQSVTYLQLGNLTPPQPLQT
jgi:hypothetical protein